MEASPWLTWLWGGTRRRHGGGYGLEIASQFGLMGKLSLTTAPYRPNLTGDLDLLRRWLMLVW